MSQPHDPIQQASDRYHVHYSDVSYKAIQRAVIADLYGPDDTPDWEQQFEARLSHTMPNRLMNTVTDAASEICQWRGFQGSLIRLGQELVLHRVSWATTQLIVDYLHRFEMSEETYSVDLHATVQAMHFILKAQPVLQEAAASACDIHSSRGRAAHDLLVAAEQLTRAAQLLLSGEGDLSYMSEKIMCATERIALAQSEKPFHVTGSP
jgi:hypothetical protein